nr:immunoglobulin heavy chain junction region [Macaca mulatta]
CVRSGYNFWSGPPDYW